MQLQREAKSFFGSRIRDPISILNVDREQLEYRGTLSSAHYQHHIQSLVKDKK